MKKYKKTKISVKDNLSNQEDFNLFVSNRLNPILETLAETSEPIFQTTDQSVIVLPICDVRRIQVYG